MTELKLLCSYDTFDYTPEMIKESREANSGKVILKGILQKSDTLNQNGRIYPRHILEREIRNYQKFIIENRALGECVPAGTEILTRDGWRNIETVVVGDIVATLNVATDEIEYQRVEHKTDKQYNGDLLHMRNARSFDMLVTPDHKVVLWDRAHRPHFMPASEVYDKVRSESSWMAHSCLRRNGTWLGEDLEYFDVPGHGLVKSELWAAFLGIYIAEGAAQGTVSGNKSDGVGSIHISQCNAAHPEVFAKIRSLLQEMNLFLSECDRGFSVKSNAKLYEHLYALSYSHKKHIPLYAKGWSPRLLEIMLDWMLMGDGRNRHGSDGELIKELSTTSRQLADDVCEVMLKLGHGGTTHVLAPGDRGAPDFNTTGRMILAENSAPLYTVYQHTSKGMALDHRFVLTDTVSYEGTVHCVTVPNGTWLMRQNGRACWTGNCDHPDDSVVNLKNVSHIVRSAEMKDDGVVYGSIELLNTPSGMILQSLVDSGVKLGISSRGVGSTHKEGNNQVVGDDYLLIAFDMVSEPSTSSAFMLPEGRKINPEQLREVFSRSDRIDRVLNDIIAFKR